MLAFIESLDAVIWLRRSVWGYAGVNALHILGIALLVGSIVNVDLRLSGLWRGERWREAVADTLPVARLGFGIAVATGAMLFSVRAGKYIENPAFILKMVTLGVALANVVLYHAILETTERTVAMRASALASLILWIAVLVFGRAVAFV